MKKQNRWSNEEFELLKSLMYKNIAYNELLNYFPNRSKDNIKNKIEREKLCDGFIRSDMWSKDEINLLIELYPKTKNDKLTQYFPNKTKGAIYTKAKRLGLSKSYEWRVGNFDNNCNNVWNDSKSSELKVVFCELGEEGAYTYFKEKYNHGKYYIINKLKELGIMEGDRVLIYDRNNPNLRDVFIVYKKILNNEIESFQKYIKNITKEQLLFLYKYYNRINKIEVSEEYFKNSTIGNLLKQAKIKQLVKARYHSYFDFICACYPKLSLKQWDFKKLNVKDGFWDNKYNRFWCIRDGIISMINDNIINKPEESLIIDHKILQSYTNSSLIYYYGKECILEYLEFTNQYSGNDLKIYNGIRFDSYQERQVYKYIYENITTLIYKCKKNDGFLYYNRRYDERYIPDFYIKLKDRSILLIEYFGMQREDNPNKIFQEYCQKTYRKINYFRNVYGDNFIDLYPKDLLSGFKGVREKLTSFYISKNIDLKGGGTDE